MIKIGGKKRMAKTIKFNMICNGKPIRTIEDLQHNFCIEDVLEYYHNNLLLRWLLVRGYDDEFQKVKAITTQDTFTILTTLINIFKVETCREKVYENTYILKYKKEREILLGEYRKMEFEASERINDYHVGYKKLIDTIIDNKYCIGVIKAALTEIELHYYLLLEINYRELFYHLFQEAPMALLCMLMKEKIRYFYLPKQDEELYGDKKAIYNLLCRLLTYEKLTEVLGDNLLSFAGITDGYWKDLESKGKRYMILKMEYGNFVRDAGISGVELSSSSINEKFIILDGLDYKSNNTEHKLLYMEV